MKKLFYVTEAGVEELQLELERLVLQRAPIAERIKTAREFGDLAENAEYIAACQEYEYLEGRISKLEAVLQNVKLIVKPEGANQVMLGSKAALEGGGKTMNFQVVGTIEADPLGGKISDESPIGQQLLGKKKGDIVKIKNPRGTVDFVITEIA